MPSRPRTFVAMITLAMLVSLALSGCTANEDPHPDLSAAEHRREAASPVLLEALRDGPAERKRRAVVAMGRIQDDAYAPALARATAPAVDRFLRMDALFALGQLGLVPDADPPAAAAAACREALSEADAEIVAAALECLGKLCPADLAARAVPLFAHEAAIVRTEAAHAMLRYRFVPVWRGTASAAPELPADAARALAAALNDSSEDVRRAAAHAMSRYGQPSAAGALAEAASDSDGWVRMFAVRGVARSDATDLASKIVAGLSDAFEPVRTETVTALARLGRVDLLPPQVADDPSFHVRAALARALAGSDSPSRDLLGRIRADPSPTVRAALVAAIDGSALDPWFVESLGEALEDDDWVLRSAAVRAVASLPPHAALTAFRRAASDDDARVRAAAIGALGPLLDRAGAVELVRDALRSDSLAVRGTAVPLLRDVDHPDRVAWLMQVYEDSRGADWIEIREGVVDTLAAIEGTDDALAAIAGRDPARAVALKARSALGQRGVEIDATPAGSELPPGLGTRYEGEPRVRLETSKGVMTLRCYPDEAPLHVANFLSLVERGYYDGLIWHRVVSNFVIQGGDPTGTGWGGPGYAIPDEINRQRFRRGTLGMPKAGKDTGGGQIFINHAPTPHLDGNYTVFGQVIDGLDVIDRIEVGDTIVRARRID